MMIPVLPSTVNPLERWEDPDGWRWYKRDGKLYISVTKVLDVAVPESLQNWWKKNTPKAIDKKSGAALTHGSTLHNALETYVKTKVVPEGSRDFIEQFIAWAAFTGLELEQSEVAVASDELGHAGTLDLLGTLKGKPMILDLKTGRNYGIKTGYQLAAYKYAWEEMTGTFGYGMAGIHATLQDTILTPDGEQQVYAFKLFEYEHMEFCLQRFLCCLEVWRGLYFNKLKALEWPWLNDYTANRTFRGTP